MQIKPSFKMSVAELPARNGELRDTLAAGGQVTLAPPEAGQANPFLNFLNSPAGLAMIAKYNSPAFAAQPVLHLDPKAARQVQFALAEVGAAPPPGPAPVPGPTTAPATAPRTPRRLPLAAQAAQQPAPAPAIAPQYLNFNWPPVQMVPLPFPLLPTSPAPAPLAPKALTPREDVAVGAAGGSLLGAGMAQIFNMLRHVDQSGVGAILFAVAGAAMGAGAGTLIGAKLVKPWDVINPALKIVSV